MSACSRFFNVAVGLACVLAGAGTSWAQTATANPALLSPQHAAEKALVLEERRESVAIYPAGLAGGALTSASITAGQDEKRVKITVAVAPFASQLAQLGLTASAPLNEDGARSELVGLTGLANKSTVGFNLRFGKHTLPNSADAGAIAATLVGLCAKTGAPKTERPGSGLIVQGCSLEELARVYPSEVANALQGYRKIAWFVAMDAEVGSQKYEFAAIDSLADAAEREWTKSGSLLAGLLFTNNLYATAGVRIERGYQGSKNAGICTTQAPSACPVKPFGPPSNDDRNVLEAEARKFVTQHFGVSAIVRWDWLNAESSVEAPLYFIRDKDGGLSGGVSLGYVWSDEEKQQGPRFTLFVSQAFKLGL